MAVGLVIEFIIVWKMVSLIYADAASDANIRLYNSCCLRMNSQILMVNV